MLSLVQVSSAKLNPFNFLVRKDNSEEIMHINNLNIRNMKKTNPYKFKTIINFSLLS